MPKFNDPALAQQRRDLGQQIDARKQQIEAAPDGEDTSAQEQQLDQLEAQMRALNQQQKDARSANKAAWKDAKRSGTARLSHRIAFSSAHTVQAAYDGPRAILPP